MAEAKIFYESDCNLSVLDGKTVAIIGFGSQGHAHALNLHESGVNVIVGLYEGSKSWKKVEDLGLKVMTTAEAVKAADIIMKMTEEIIDARKVTAMMVTHNMQFAIEFGNRLIMMDAGRVILDIQGDEKKNMTVERLVELFKEKSSKTFSSDEALLTK